MQRRRGVTLRAIFPIMAFSTLILGACSDALSPDVSTADASRKKPPADTTSTPTPPPAPPAPPPTTTPAPSVNPLVGAALYVDPYSKAKKQADAWRSTRPADAVQLDKIASQAQTDWFGDWNADIKSEVSARTTTITNAGKLPVFVAYNIPKRDCGSYSAGGAASADAYRTWIRNFAAGIGTRKAVVILEPDALAAMSCLSATEQQTLRIDLIKDAVQVFKAQGNIAVYIDAGHPGWQSAATMIQRLSSASVANADGFSLNISNFETNANVESYGNSISNGLNGKHFVFDSSRNGLGAGSTWCNPDGRGLGTSPTTSTGRALIDAILWIKHPGESDGTCNGGPNAGVFWADYALGLAVRSNLTASYSQYLASN